MSYFAQTPHGKEAQPNNNRSKLIGIGGGFKDKGSACSRPSNTVRKRSNTANWARHRPVSIERREFQKLEQSFTLADNEQWDEDNNHKMAHTPESHGPSGATLAAEEEHILRCLGAALIMQWNALSTKLRRELFDNAGSMGELLETPALRGQVARFLHKHKDDEDYSSNMIRTEKTDAAAVARWDDEGGASQAPEQQRMRKSKIPTSHAVNR